MMNDIGVKITDVESDLNWYAIDKNGSALFADDTLVRARNSKEALEKLIGKKVKRSLGYYEHFDYVVRLSNEQGQTWRDRRKTIYYKVIEPVDNSI